jgi:hypothetical protein
MTTDMNNAAARPYFLWDEDTSIADVRSAIAVGVGYDHDRLLGKMLREARDIDVWHFTTPAHVAAHLERLQRIVGRRYAFWRYLIDGWRQDGLL